MMNRARLVKGCAWQQTSGAFQVIAQAAPARRDVFSYFNELAHHAHELGL